MTTDIQTAARALMQAAERARRDALVNLEAERIDCRALIRKYDKARERLARLDAEYARVEAQKIEDIARQALERAQKCDGDHIGPACSDKQCWLRDPEEAGQPTMSCPSCKREYPDFDGAGVVFCDPKQGGCGFCRHVELKGQPMGDKTVMVCTACWEAQEEEQPKPKPEPYRAGLPPERLRKVWAEWEDGEGDVVTFKDEHYHWSNWRASMPVKRIHDFAWIGLKLKPLGKTWAEVEAMAEAAEKPDEPKMLDLTKLPEGTVCEATKFFGIYNSGIMLNAGDRFRVVGQADGDLPVLIEVGGKDWWLSALVPARVVKEGGER